MNLKKSGLKALKYLQDIDRDDVLESIGLQERRSALATTLGKPRHFRARLPGRRGHRIGVRPEVGGRAAQRAGRQGPAQGARAAAERGRVREPEPLPRCR